MTKQLNKKELTDALLTEMRRVRKKYGKHFSDKDRRTIDALTKRAQELLNRPVGRPKGAGVASIDLDHAAKLRERGKRWDDIAAEFGVPTQAIYYAFRSAERALPVKGRAGEV